MSEPRVHIMSMYVSHQRRHKDSLRYRTIVEIRESGSWCVMSCFLPSFSLD